MIIHKKGVLEMSGKQTLWLLCRYLREKASSMTVLWNPKLGLGLAWRFLILNAVLSLAVLNDDDS